MIGHAYAAGNRHGNIRLDTSEIAEYVSILPGRLERALELLHTGELPQIVLLQNTSASRDRSGDVLLFGLVKIVRQSR